MNSQLTYQASQVRRDDLLREAVAQRRARDESGHGPVPAARRRQSLVTSRIFRHLNARTLRERFASAG